MHILHTDIVIVIADIRRIILVVNANLAQQTLTVLTGIAIVIVAIPRTMRQINAKNLTVRLTLMYQETLVYVTITM